MQQKILEFHVEDQHIHAPHYRVVGDSRNYLVARFSFGPAWRGLTKTAVFQGADGNVYHLLIENDRCVVPAEVLQPTRFTLSVFGGDRLTTDRAVVTVEASGMVEGVSPPTPTPDIYDQLLDSVATERQLASAAAVTAGEKADVAVAATATAQTAMEEARDAAAAAAASAVQSEQASQYAESYAGETAENTERSTLAADRAEAAAKKADEQATRAREYATLAQQSADTAVAAAEVAAGNANDAAAVTTEAMKAYAILADEAIAATAAANDAAIAAAGADKVNIQAVQTATGATITVTDRDGVDTTVHLDTLLAVNGWADVQNAVRLGLGAKLFPVGYEFVTQDANTGQNITWVVRGHDHHAAANRHLTHTMTLEAKEVCTADTGGVLNLMFDAPEALYCATEELPAGTYHFVWNYETGVVANGTYQFTLTSAVPAGGQIVLNTNSSASAITACRISTYESPSATAAIESDVAVSIGDQGAGLGTISNYGASNQDLNCAQRILWGSNNYAQSDVRQWLNSDAPAGAVWTPTNRFDRPPTWANIRAGLMNGLPADFLAAVQTAVIPCHTNNTREVKSLDGTSFSVKQQYVLQDAFFLLSRPEIYGTWENADFRDGDPLEYYNGLTDTERIKYTAAGTARACWLRSPNPWNATNQRTVNASGKLDHDFAMVPNSVAPACIIA